MSTTLSGQTVVVLGGSAGIGLETARIARAEGAEVVLTGRSASRLEAAAADIGAQRTVAFDVNDAAALEQFFADMPDPIDHVLVSGPGPRYKPPLEMEPAELREALAGHAALAIDVARITAGRIRPGGALILIGGTGGRHIARGYEIYNAVTAALPALTASLALDLAPVRVNLIAPGFVDTPLSASLLGDDLDARRSELRGKLPIGRVVGPVDVAALAIHLMSNTALTGATYDIDGGQQFVA